MKIVFLRHGECITNTHSYIEGQYAYNFLTLRGVKQAELAAMDMTERGYTHFDAIYTSSKLRAMQTANTVLQTMGIHGTYPCIQEPLLNEWWDDPKGLTQDAFRKQISKFFNKVLKSVWLSDTTIMVVSHGYAMRVLFEEIQLYLGQIESLSENIHRIPHHAPNAMPFYYDTIDSGKKFKYTVPGEHSIRYASQ